MGNSNKKLADYDVIHSFQPQQWTNKEKREGYQIWENTQRKITADVYPLQTQLTISELDYFEMRHSNIPDIVQVYNLQFNKDNNLCTTSNEPHVFVERIPFRLSQINDLTNSQALTTLRSTYSGFNTISTFYDSVEPYEDLICYNEEGRPKVWINSNLSQNRIQKDRVKNPAKSIQNYNQAYVNKIFSMVQNKTLNKTLPETLKNKFRQSNPKTYFEALNVIQQFAAENGIEIYPTIEPHRLQTIQVQESPSRGQFFNYAPPGRQNNVSSEFAQQKPFQNPIFTAHPYPQNTVNYKPSISPPSLNLSNPIQQSKIITSQQPFKPMMPNSNLNNPYYRFPSQLGQSYQPQTYLPASSPNLPILPLGSSSNIFINSQPAAIPPTITFNQQKNISNFTSLRTIPLQTSNVISPSKITFFHSPPKIATQQIFKGNPSYISSPMITHQLKPQQPLGVQNQPVLPTFREVQSVQNSPTKPATEQTVMKGEQNFQQNSAKVIKQQPQSNENTGSIPYPITEQKGQKLQIQQYPYVQRQTPLPQPQPIHNVKFQSQPLQQVEPFPTLQSSNLQRPSNTSQFPLTPIVSIATSPLSNQQPIQHHRKIKHGYSPQTNFQQSFPKFQLPHSQGRTRVQPQPKQFSQTQQKQHIQLTPQQLPPQQVNQSNQQDADHQLEPQSSIQRQTANNQQHQQEKQQKRHHIGQISDSSQLLQSAKFNTLQPHELSKPIVQPSEVQNEKAQLHECANNENTQINNSLNVVQDSHPKEYVSNESIRKQLKKLQKIVSDVHIQNSPLPNNSHADVEAQNEIRNEESLNNSQLNQENINQQAVQIKNDEQQNNNEQQNNDEQQNNEFLQLNEKPQVVSEQPQFQCEPESQPQPQIKPQLEFEHQNKSRPESQPPPQQPQTIAPSLNEPKNDEPHLQQQLQQNIQPKINMETKVPSQQQKVKKEEIKSIQPNTIISSDANLNTYANDNIVNNEKAYINYEDYSNTTGLPYLHKNRQKHTQQPSNGNRIPDDARYDQIEQYIRNKYKTFRDKSDTRFKSQMQTIPNVIPTTLILRRQESDSIPIVKYQSIESELYSPQINVNRYPINKEFIDKYNQKPIIPQKISTINKNENQNRYGKTENEKKGYQISNDPKKQGKKQYKQDVQEDLLDVGFMERSLDRRYKSRKSEQQVKRPEPEKKPQSGSNHQFDVQKLEENLRKFQENRTVSKPTKPEISNANQPRFETSQVVKFNGSSDYQLRPNVFKEEEAEDYGRILPKPSDYQSPFYSYERANGNKHIRVSKQIDKIDQKFDKYVSNISRNQVIPPSTKPLLKPKQQNENEALQSQNKITSGHFGSIDTNKLQDPINQEINNNHYQDNFQKQDGRRFVTSQVVAHKGLTYSDLRKFLWS